MDNLCTFQAGLRTTEGFRSWSVVLVLSFFLAGGLIVGDSSRGDDKPAMKRSKASAKPMHATKVEGVGESADDSEWELDEDLSALVVPSRFLAKSRETDRLKFSLETRGLLLEGFKEKSDGLEAARKHLESAHMLVADDPRAAYSYGVVLLAQKKSVLALEQFRTAARLKKAPFLPALQGIAWISLSRGEYTQAFSALLDLAHRLEESHETWPTVQDKEHSAEWLGRMIGYLAGPGKTDEQAAQIQSLAADVDRLLTAERKQAYEHGRKVVAVRHEELKAFAARPDGEVLAEVRQKREDILAAAAAAESEGKQLEEELRELKKPHDKQLADLSREIRSNAAKIKSTTPKVEDAEGEVEEFSKPKLHPQLKNQGMRRPAQVVGRSENAGEKKIRESQLASAEKKLDQLKSSLEKARQDIVDARKQRDAAQVEYHQATAGKRQALQAAQHKAAELSARARDAEQGSLTPEKLKARVTALEAYVPLYPELEKDRLLATLKTAS